jgi:hypothetical protein
MQLFFNLFFLLEFNHSCRQIRKKQSKIWHTIPAG